MKDFIEDAFYFIKENIFFIIICLIIALFTFFVVFCIYQENSKHGNGVLIDKNINNSTYYMKSGNAMFPYNSKSYQIIVKDFKLGLIKKNVDFEFYYNIQVGDTVKY